MTHRPHLFPFARAIITACGEHLGCTFDEVVSMNNTKCRVAYCRQVSMYLLQKTVGMSPSEVSRFIGSNHATVLHATASIRSILVRHPKFQNVLTAIVEEASAAEKIAA